MRLTTLSPATVTPVISFTPNQQTLAVYNEEALTWIENTPARYLPYHAQMLHWIDTALEGLNPGGKILEIGSATPRDARYMYSKGFTVQCSDATPAFVSFLRQQGEDAINLDIINDSVGSTDYDLIFANAVVPHFTEADFALVLDKIKAMLRPGKFFAFNAKQGNGEKWILEKKVHGKRYAHYWQPYAICKVINEFGFKVVFIQTGAPGDLGSHKWINIIAQVE
jgi:2-polyprenyl-3-methyl-5-hydroxy-6-metoxy-1,4-benzoquinol methylase